MKKWLASSLLVLGMILGFSGCSYTESALQYAQEGTKRVNAGYQAKADMTKEVVKYLKEVNKDCGVTSQFIDGIPTTTVKECVRAQDVFAVVDRVEIIQPQKINDIVDSAGDFIMKSTNLVVPVAGVYYNYKTHQSSMDASIKNTASNNELQGTIFESYTGNYQNTSVTTTTTTTDVSDTTVTDTSTVNTTNTTVDSSNNTTETTQN